MAEEEDLSPSELEALIQSQMEAMDETVDDDMFSMGSPRRSPRGEDGDDNMDDLFGELMESNRRTEVEDIDLGEMIDGTSAVPLPAETVPTAAAQPADASLLLSSSASKLFNKPAVVLPEIRLVVGLLVDAVEEGQSSSMQRNQSGALETVDQAVVQAAVDSAKADYKIFDEFRENELLEAAAVLKSPDEKAIELVVNNFWSADEMMRTEEARRKEVAKALGEVESLRNMRDEEHELILAEERKRRAERKRRREEEALRWKRITAVTTMQRFVRGCMGRVKVFEVVSAINIQALWRGAVVRMRIARVLETFVMAQLERKEEEREQEEMEKEETLCWVLLNLEMQREEVAALAAEDLVSLALTIARRGEDDNLTQMALEDIASRSLGPRSPRHWQDDDEEEEDEEEEREEGGDFPHGGDAWGTEEQVSEGDWIGEKSTPGSDPKTAVPPLELTVVGPDGDDEVPQYMNIENDERASSEPMGESVEERAPLEDVDGGLEGDDSFHIAQEVEDGWLLLVQENQRHLASAVDFAQNVEFDAAHKMPRTGNDRMKGVGLFDDFGERNVGDAEHPLMSAHAWWVEQYSMQAGELMKELEDAPADESHMETEAAVNGDGRGDLLLNPASSLAVDLSVEGLSDLSVLHGATSLRKLDVSVNKLRTLKDISHLHGLLEIVARDNAIEDIEALSGLTALKSLSLDTNQLTDATPLVQLTHLSSLAARMNRFTSFPDLPSSIERLELYHNQIASVPSERLAALKRLTYLDLGRNKLESIDGAALSQCQALTHLVLSQNKLVEVPAPLHLPMLRILWLSGNRLKSLSPWEPAGADDSPLFVPLLEQLYLQDNSISAMPVAVGQLLPCLAELDISFNDITSADGLLGLRECPVLKTANVQDNPVTTSADPSRWLHVLCPSLMEVNGRKDMAQATYKHTSVPALNAFGRWTQASSHAIPVSGTEGSGRGEAFQSFSTSNGSTGTGSVESALESFLNSSLDVELTADGVRVGDLVEMHANRVRQASAFAADATTVETLRASPPAPVVRRFLHFLSLLMLKQNISRARTAGEGADTGCNFVDELRELIAELAGWRLKDSEDARGAMTHTGAPVFVDLAVEEVEEKYKGGIGAVRAEGIKAVTRLQAFFRGVMSRVTVKNAFASVKFQDDELDAMFNGEDDLDGMLGDMGVRTTIMPEMGSGNRSRQGTGDSKREVDQDRLGASRSESRGSGLPELRENWLGSTASGQLFASSVVYGDHRRRKASAGRLGLNSEGSYGIPGEEMPLSEGDYFPGAEPPEPEPEPAPEPASGSPPGSEVPKKGPTLAGGVRTGSNLSLSDGFTVRPLAPVQPSPMPPGDENMDLQVRPSHGGRILHNPLPPVSGRGAGAAIDMSDELDRPVSAMSEISGLSMDSRARSEQGGRAAVEEDFSPRSQLTDGTSVNDRSTYSKAQREEEIAEEWGINDPTVLAAMMKRNRRLKAFKKQASDRESNKSAQVRYDKFLKSSTSGKTSGGGAPKRSGRSAMGSKGSFGGAPKTFRPSGTGKHKKKAIPAWKLGTDAHDEGDY